MENPGIKSPGVACFGESFWSVAADRPSGLPALLSYQLYLHRVKPMLITRVGIDEQGKRIIQFIEQLKLCTDYFQIDYEYSTALLSGKGPGHCNPLLHAWNHITPDTLYMKVLEQADLWVHSSLPACHAGTTTLQTMLELMRMNIKRAFYLTLDTSFPARPVLEKCLNGAYILCTGVNEVELITGWFSRTNSLRERVELLQEKFMIPYIIIPYESGYLINANGKTYRQDQQYGEVSSEGIDNIAFMAAFISSILNNADIAHAIAFSSHMKTLSAISGETYPVYSSDQLYQHSATNGPDASSAT